MTKRSSKRRLGTYAHKDGRYGSRIAVAGKRLHLGLWRTERLAGLAYDRAVLYFSLNRPLNFPESAGRLGPASPTTLRSEAILETKRQAHKVSPYIGVTHCRQNGRWQARATVRGRPDQHLGYFDDAESAARVRDCAAYAEFGNDAVLNFPRSRRRHSPTCGAGPKRNRRPQRRDKSH